MRVLRERDEMVAKTIERQPPSRTSSSRLPTTDYQAAMARARREASGIREEARAEGRKILEDMKGRACRGVAVGAAEGNRRAQGAVRRRSTPICRSSMETLAATLASRVLGVDVAPRAGAKTGR